MNTISSSSNIDIANHFRVIRIRVYVICCVHHARRIIGNGNVGEINELDDLFIGLAHAPSQMDSTTEGQVLRYILSYI